MLNLVPKRHFVKHHKRIEDRYKVELERYRGRRLKLATRLDHKPDQYKRPAYDPDPIVVTQDRKLVPLNEARLPYKEYSKESIDKLEKFETFYDPNFNPHLYDERNRINPDEEPFKSIYADDERPDDQYTKVRNITTPELWKFVEDLAPLKVNPPVKRRMPGEPIEATPSGWVPPPEQPPDLPYYVARTRNQLLPVYYYLHSDPDQCSTILKRVTGDLWKLEEDLRLHLEGLLDNKRRILTSVQETDGRILFRGRFLHQVVNWLHQKGF